MSSRQFLNKNRSISAGLVNQARIVRLGLSNYVQDSYQHFSLSTILWQSLLLICDIENKVLCAIKLLNMDSSLVALERKYQQLEVEDYMFHVFETERL